MPEPCFPLTPSMNSTPRRILGAEYGWKPGAVVNVGIKSGTNNVHGTAFAFGRETALDSHNPFDPAGAPKTPVELEQFGGSFGGPLKKDKFFYFGNFEAQRYSVGSTNLVTDPITAGAGASLYPGLVVGGVILPPGTPAGLIGGCQFAAANGGVSALSAQSDGPRHVMSHKLSTIQVSFLRLTEPMEISSALD